MKIDARRLVSGRGLLVTVVAAGVLAGGGAATAFAAHDDGPGTAVPSGDRGAGTRVTAAGAAGAALRAVPGGRVEEIELDDEGGKSVWEIGVLDGNGGRRGVTVDSGTGKVLSNRADRPDDDSDDQDPAALRNAKVAASDAAGAALKSVPGTVTSVDFEGEHGKAVWEVDVTGRDGTERELTVDAATAKVQTGGTDDD